MDEARWSRPSVTEYTEIMARTANGRVMEALSVGDTARRTEAEDIRRMSPGAHSPATSYGIDGPQRKLPGLWRG